MMRIESPSRWRIALGDRVMVVHPCRCHWPDRPAFISPAVSHGITCNTCCLRQLGHDVYYLEDSGEWPYSLGGERGDDYSANSSADIVISTT
jgi:hypothetical protein